MPDYLILACEQLRPEFLTVVYRREDDNLASLVRNKHSLMTPQSKNCQILNA